MGLGKVQDEKVSLLGSLEELLWTLDSCQPPAREPLGLIVFHPGRYRCP